MIRLRSCPPPVHLRDTDDYGAVSARCRRHSAVCDARMRVIGNLSRVTCKECLALASGDALNDAVMSAQGAA